MSASTLTIRASALRQAQLCPHSVRAQIGLPDVGDKTVAERGTRIHAALAGDQAAIAALDDDERQCYAACASIAARHIADIVGDDSRITKNQVEASLGIVGLTGHPDLVVFYKPNDDTIKTTEALVLDYKTGWGDVDEPAYNMQLRAYALMVFAMESDLTAVTCAIVQPSKKSVEPVRYTREHLPQIRAELDTIRGAAALSQPPCNPSADACKYCRAAGTDRCPASAKTLAVVESNGGLVDVAQLDAVLKVAPVVERIIKLAKERAREMLTANPDALPGWALKAGANVRKVEDANAAWHAVGGVIGNDAFVGCCKVSVSDLESAYGKAQAIKGKQLKDEFGVAMGDALTVKQNAPSLVEV